MKCKVFIEQSENIDLIEDAVNSFLEESKDVVINHILQSCTHDIKSHEDSFVILTIFYSYLK